MAAAGVASAAAGVFGADRSADTQVAHGSSHRQPKNVIFLLGDGMGTQEITAARYYQGVAQQAERRPAAVHRLRHDLVGQAGRRAAVPARLRPRLGLHGHDVGDRQEDDRRAHLAGAQQRRERAGREPKTVLEIAQKRGMKVGDVSTAEITDATPAVLASHISLRGCQGPANMAACPTETKAAGGLGSIAEQEVDHKVDVLLGGGRSRFEQTITGGPFAGKTVVAAGAGQGLPVRHRRCRPARRERRQAGARPVQQWQHVARVERPGRRAGQGQRARRLHREPAPGQRAEPRRR